MKKYRLTGQAIDDLNKIWIYTLENWSTEQANRYYRLIIEEIRYIATDSESGREANGIKPRYRVSKIKSHLIFYREGEDDIIEIIRILHERMDIKSKLK